MFNLVLFLGAVLSVSAMAEDKNVSTGSVAFTSNYVFRGVSQTGAGRDKMAAPAIQGSMDYAHSSGVFAGFWASNVSFNPYLETDPYVGYNHSLGEGMSVSLAAMNYTYIYNPSINSLEFQPKFTWNDLKVGFNYSAKWAGTDGYGMYGWTSWAKAYGSFTPGLAFGYTMVSNKAAFKNYGDYKVSVAAPFEGFTWEVAMTGVTKKQFGNDDKNKGILTVSKSF